MKKQIIRREDWLLWLTLILVTIGIAFPTATAVAPKPFLLHLGVWLTLALWLWRLPTINAAQMHVVHVSRSLYICWLLWIVWTALTCWQSDFRWAGVSYLQQQISLAILFFLIWQVVRTEKQVRRGLFCLMLVFGLTAVYGILQAYGLSPFPWQMAPMRRPDATFGNPVFFSGFLVMLLPVALMITWHKKTWPNRALYGSLIVLGLYALALTQTRASWLIAFLGMFIVIVYVIWPKSEHKHSGWIKRLMMGVIGISIVFSLIMALIPAFWTRFSHLLAPAAYGERAHIWQAAIAMFDWRNVTGLGPDTFQVYFPKFRDPAYRALGFADIVEHVHNEYIEVALDQGLIGLVLFLSLIFISGWHVRRHWSGASEYQKGIAFAIWIGLGGVLALNLINIYFRCTVIPVLFWTLAAISIVLVRSNSAEQTLPDSARPLNRNISRFLSLFALISMVILGADEGIRIFSQINERLGDEAMDRNEFRTAANFYDRASRDYSLFSLKYQPVERPLVLAKWGYVLLQQREFETALGIYNRLKPISPWYPEVDFYRGECFRLMNDDRQALAAYQASFLLAPDAKHYFRIGTLQLALGDTLTGRDHLLQAVRQFAQELKLNDHHQQERQEADLKTAYERWWQTVQLPADSTYALQALIPLSTYTEPGMLVLWTQRYLGQIYLQLRQWSKAIPQFEAAIRTAPNDVIALATLGHLYVMTQQQPQTALTFLQRAGELQPALAYQLLPDQISAQLMLNQPRAADSLLTLFRQMAQARRDSLNIINACLLDYAVGHVMHHPARIQKAYQRLQPYMQRDSMLIEKVRAIEHDFSKLGP